MTARRERGVAQGLAHLTKCSFSVLPLSPLSPPLLALPTLPQAVALQRDCPETCSSAQGPGALAPLNRAVGSGQPQHRRGRLVGRVKGASGADSHGSGQQPRKLWAFR